MDLDDIRFLLAVAETGTTLAAARRLGVSQSTVARRIAGLEARTGVQFFDKRRTGYVATENAVALIEPARAVAGAAETFQLALERLRRDVSGIVRFTTSDLLAGLFLPQIVAGMKARYPAVQVEVDTSAAVRDLSNGEADVALRSVTALETPDLFGRRLAVDHWSLYCSRRYADLHGVPRSLEELAGHALVALSPGAGERPVLEWAQRHFPTQAIVVRLNTVPSSFASVRAGTGIGLYSEAIAAFEPDMVFCFRPDLPPTLEIWLVTHERLKGVARVRALMEVAGEVVKARLGGARRGG